MLSILDLEFSREQYRRYVRYYWNDLGLLAGFREWPPGRAGRMDADSGPIIAGLGMAATGFGIGATIAMGDRWRTWRLNTQIAALDAAVWAVTLGRTRPIPGWDRLGTGAPSDPRAVTGFLFGDVCLFLALSWPGPISDG